VILYFGQFFLITEVAQIFGLLFSTEKGLHYFQQKWVGLHFRQFFSQTHQVTLIGSDSDDEIDRMN
jgi:hypothetical protein